MKFEGYESLTKAVKFVKGLPLKSVTRIMKNMQKYI